MRLKRVFILVKKIYLRDIPSLAQKLILGAGKPHPVLNIKQR